MRHFVIWLDLFSVNGSWNNWGSWSSCPPCGNVTQTRSRNCTVPQFGGFNCSGNWTVTTQCQIPPCPGKPQWFAELLFLRLKQKRIPTYTTWNLSNSFRLGSNWSTSTDPICTGKPFRISKYNLSCVHKPQWSGREPEGAAHRNHITKTRALDKKGQKVSAFS